MLSLVNCPVEYCEAVRAASLPDTLRRLPLVPISEILRL